MHRRTFISSLAAPLVVKAGVLMPVRPLEPPRHLYMDFAVDAHGFVLHRFEIDGDRIIIEPIPALEFFRA